MISHHESKMAECDVLAGLYVVSEKKHERKKNALWAFEQFSRAPQFNGLHNLFTSGKRTKATARLASASFVAASQVADIPIFDSHLFACMLGFVQHHYFLLYLSDMNRGSSRSSSFLTWTHIISIGRSTSLSTAVVLFSLNPRRVAL